MMHLNWTEYTGKNYIWVQEISEIYLIDKANIEQGSSLGDRLSMSNSVKSYSQFKWGQNIKIYNNIPS